MTQNTYQRTQIAFGRHTPTEWFVFLAVMLAGMLLGVLAQRTKHQQAMDNLWDEAERRGHAERHYDGPFDTQPTRRWKDAEEEAR